jgi:hypothetical protein
MLSGLALTWVSSLPVTHSPHFLPQWPQLAGERATAVLQESTKGQGNMCNFLSPSQGGRGS